MKKLLIFCLVVPVSLAITACSGSPASSISVDSSLKVFLDSAIPSDTHVLYALEEAVPVTMDDLKQNGLLVCGTPPENFFVSNVSSALYHGGFVPGTMVVLTPTTDGIDKFGGMTIKVAVSITANGCKKGMKEKDGAAVMLIERDTKDLDTAGLVEVVFK